MREETGDRAGVPHLCGQKSVIPKRPDIEVERLHEIALERFGGSPGLRDKARFESAVMHPQNVFFYGRGSVFEIAAAYCFHLPEAQAFLDGNKRTGAAAAIVFLECNGSTA